jgi:hypothetical protein
MAFIDEHGDPTSETMQNWNEANDYTNEGEWSDLERPLAREDVELMAYEDLERQADEEAQRWADANEWYPRGRF